MEIDASPHPLPPVPPGSPMIPSGPSPKPDLVDWIEILVEVAPSYQDSITNYLWEQGISGVTESNYGKNILLQGYALASLADQFGQPFQDYLESLSTMNPELAVPVVSVNPVKKENWSERYKDFYRAQRFGHHFHLIPLWDKQTIASDRRLPIHLEPGQAFGTGLHPTTKLCARYLEELMGDSSLRRIQVLDVGTGTGILAIVADKLGACRVLAIDNDPLAVEAAEENAKVNHCEHTEVSEALVETLEPGFDIIVANILLEVHRELLPHYRRLLNPNGRLVLSGLLGDQRLDIEEAALHHGFECEGARNFQEWAAYLYRPAYERES